MRSSLDVFCILVIIAPILARSSQGESSARPSRDPSALSRSAPARGASSTPASLLEHGLAHRWSTARGGALAAPLAKATSKQTTAKATANEPAAEIGIVRPTLSAFLYVLAMAFTIPVVPKMINSIMGDGEVTGAGASLYGLVSSLDSFFTFLTVNLLSSLSDRFGRRPFMALAALGLGTGFAITATAKTVWPLLVAATIDGCTSCMTSIGQAALSDCVGTDSKKLSQAFGLFQGLALGMAFTIGIPLGGILNDKYGPRHVLAVAIGICALNVLYIAAVVPETLPKERRAKKADLSKANPWGAVRMLRRNKLLGGVTIYWALLWLAHSGLQITWMNYTELKFGWGASKSGPALALLGVLIAALPRVIIPRLGLERSISAGLLVYTVSQVVIGSAPAGYGVWSDLALTSGLVLSALGSIVFPATLTFLSLQVGPSEKGAIQGAIDTVRTLSNVIGSAGMSQFFGFFISPKAPCQVMGASFYLGAGLAALAWICSVITFSDHGHLSAVANIKPEAIQLETLEP